MSNIVFVYGTLKQGYPNHKFMGSSKKLCEDTLADHYMVSVGGFPAICEVGDKKEHIGSVVHGEVYEVSDMDLRSVDGLEGYRVGYTGFYDRKTVTTDSGHEALVYFFHEDGGRELVEEGIW